MVSELAKLEAILDHTIRHNIDHAGELRSLAQRAKELGRADVHDELMKGIGHMGTANDSLALALKKLREGSQASSR